MTIEQIIVLAIVQGVTEFLPISSSGHLILVPKLLHWQDQGLVVDVMVHVGTLFAILIYFWRDVARIVRGAFELLKGKVTDNGRLAIYIILGSIPAVAVGNLQKTRGYTDHARNLAVVAGNTILYGIDVVADKGCLAATREHDLGSAMIIGVVKPSASPARAARASPSPPDARLQPDCARFSFLLGIPAIAGAGVFTVGDALASGEPVTMDAVYCAVLTFFAGLAAIAFLMALVKRVSLLPFVLYRMVLGGFLLVLLYT
jgi:undecaprenyl-diphosphatase